MTGLSRRDVARQLGGLALAGGLDLAGAAAATAAPIDQSFPKGFHWGCATAAYQIEGAVKQDGRGTTNWDLYTREPGRIVNGDTGDVACDSYNRYREDVALLKALGVGTYRFSIAWSRIFPEGRGTPNPKGIAHYDRVVDALLAAGIDPYVTLFHWDLPAALPGAWQNRDTAKAFADYCGYVAGKLSDRVKNYMTTNEIRCFTEYAYNGSGAFAPGLKLPRAEMNQTCHHGILAHGLGVQAIRAAAHGPVRVGLAENLRVYVPALDTPEHVAAAQKATRADNASFLTPIMEGKYSDAYHEIEGRDAVKPQAGDMAAIGSPLDFVGLNLYNPRWARPDASRLGYAIIPTRKTAPHMLSDWLYVGPEVGYWGVRQVSELWRPKAIYITENGASASDTVTDDRIDDVERIMYLRSYLGQYRRAIIEGYPLEGYFYWSLLDNFEWGRGYSERFGLHYVDYKTQRRIPKLSAAWYKEVIRRNALV